MVLGIFKKKEEKKEEKEIKEERKELGKCPVCNNPVYETDEYKTFSFQGQRFYIHKKCFKELRKLAKQFLKFGF